MKLKVVKTLAVAAVGLSLGGCQFFSFNSTPSSRASLASVGLSNGVSVMGLDDGGYIPPPGGGGSGETGTVPACPQPPLRMGTGFNGTVNQIQVDPAHCNRIYVSGDFTEYNGVPLTSHHLVRINQDGTLDQTFQVGSGPDAHLSGIAIAADGSGNVYLGGSFTHFAGQPYKYLVRIFPSGSVDSSFNLGDGFDDGVFRVLALHDGTNRLYAVGFFSHFNRAVAGNIVRLNADGSADPSFLSGSGFDDLVQNIVLDPADNSKLYAAGNFRNYNGKLAPCLIRLNANGTPDATFAIGEGFDSELFGITATIDGSNRIYVTTGPNPPTGQRPKFQGLSQPIGISRINPDGSLDKSFNIGRGFEDPSNPWGAAVFNLAIANDGTNRIYAAGQFPLVDGVAKESIVRLNPDGSIDPTFVTRLGFNSASYFPMLPGDNTHDVFFFGTYSTYDNNLVGGLIRLTQDGVLNSL